MEFKQFKERLQKNFAEITKDVNYIFTTDVDKDELWNLYLDSFPEGTNKIFRERREYDCSCCRHFIKSIGNVVVLKDGNIKTIWDFETGSNTFNVVTKALDKYVKSKAINNVFLSKFDKLGTDFNYEHTSDGVIKWEHFYLELPQKFVNTNRYRSIEDIQGEYRTTKELFKRSLEEISKESILTVLELINQGSLYRGEEWKSLLQSLLKLNKEYFKLDTDLEKEVFLWEKSLNAGIVVARIKNNSIGTLLVNITNDMDLDEAVRKYEVIVAPTNYKRPKAIFTKKMLEDAKNTITELGYLNSLGRRFATIDDITVNNILFSNKDVNKTEELDVFGELSKEVSVNPKKFSKVEEINIDKFVNDVLPYASELEVLLENRHSKNLVSLIAPKNKDSKTMFKWDNNFSWSYKGNITDSDIRQNVKNAGGNVDGVLRFSIQWNDGQQFNGNDLDAHCVEPDGNLIYYGERNSYSTTGNLDVDIIHPKQGVPAVENITWTNINKMQKGEYRFRVNCYSNNGGKDGFKAEISFNGELYQFEYNKPLKHKETIDVAIVNFDGQNFKIKTLLPATTSTKEIWNLTTNQFIPVSSVMYSPNYWNEQQGIGNKHYFFMLKDCINDENPNGFYNEFLKEDLIKHKRVFEALGSKMSVEDNEEQLSGLGFSSTQRNELIVKVKGQTERLLKIKF